MFSAFIDPFILACPAIEEGKIEYENFVISLNNWKEISKSTFIKPYILGNSADILMQLNKYPLYDDLKRAHSEFRIDYIPVDSVHTLVSTFLTKFDCIQKELGVEAMEYRNVTTDPNVFTEAKREPLLSSALEQILVLIGVKCHNESDNYENQLLVTRTDTDKNYKIEYEIQELIFCNDEKVNEFRFPEMKNFMISAYSNYDDFSSIKQVVLRKSSKEPKGKRIKLSNEHHGTDILQALADKMVNSPFVEEVVNSIDHNSSIAKFAHKTYPDGTIDIYLTRTEKGYGMKIQTTGTNQLETLEIAKILTSEYSHAYKGK